MRRVGTLVILPTKIEQLRHRVRTGRRRFFP